MLRKLMQKIQQAMFFRLYDGETGAPAAPPATPTIDVSQFPVELQNDAAFLEDMQKILGEEPKPEPPAADPKPDAKPAADPMTDDKTPPADDDIKDDDEIVFENDLEVEDVKFSKDVLKGLPKDFLAGIGKIKAALEEKKAKFTELESLKADMLKDPIIADRLERAKSGKGLEAYGVPKSVTKETKEAFVSALKEKGLDDAAAEEVFGKVSKEIMADLEVYSQAVLNNSLLASEQKRIEEKTNADGKAFIDELAKMGEGLTSDDVRSWCTNAGRKGSAKTGGYTYGDLLRLKESLGPEAIFAAIAKEKGLPVVLNAKERDKKLLENDRKKYIELTGAKRVAKAMKDASTGSAKAGGTILDEGASIDPAKLNDSDYIDSLLSKCKNEDEIFAMQAKLRAMAK